MFTKIKYMLEFLGETYYIDIEEVEKKISMNKKYLSNKQISDESEEPHISVSKWEIYKNLLDVILTEREELDENLGIHNAKNLTIPFKFAFNTLLINKIIKKL